MRVLITGAAGHLGGYVIGELAARGHHLVAVDQYPVQDARLDRTHVGDLQDRDVVRAALRGVDAVVHLGAIPHPNSDDDSKLFATNCLTAHRVLDEAGRAGVERIVATSSLAAVGLAWAPRPLSPRYLPLDEQHPTLVEDPYGLSKLVLEEIAHATHRRWGSDIISLRMPFTGAGTRLKTHFAEVAADPGEHRDGLWGWLDTRDAAMVIRLALTAKVRGSHVINVAAPDTSAPRPTADLLERHFPDVPVLAELPGRASLFDSTACARLLGFKPGRTRTT
ncbi:NAD-dependent epimerase/dehydratase family protein [Streptomyces sp. NPDC059477]|uniref:NAD-dependent epimerase/dehydratase family protein n=1 Tax=Streptomyces sp. NPDC059477 TaxID=3346847 RepID=UPI0036BEA47D